MSEADDRTLMNAADVVSAANGLFPRAVDAAPDGPADPRQDIGEDERRGKGDLGGRIAHRFLLLRRRLPCGLSRALLRHLPARKHNET